MRCRKPRCSDDDPLEGRSSDCLGETCEDGLALRGSGQSLRGGGSSAVTGGNVGCVGNIARKAAGYSGGTGCEMGGGREVEVATGGRRGEEGSGCGFCEKTGVKLVQSVVCSRDTLGAAAGIGGIGLSKTAFRMYA